LPSTPDEAEPWPERAPDRDLYVLGRRPPRTKLDASRPHGVLLEDERAANGAIARVAAVFLVGRECPWRCVMCDLWTHTIEEDTPVGAIPAQLDLALQAIARDSIPDVATSSIKLYNAGSFFDSRAVPLADYDAIAVRLRSFAHVVVESHPALVGDRVDRLFEALLRHRSPLAPVVELEVAMGLETANPEALSRLHKGMTLEQFSRAADALRKRDVVVRAFVLVPPPFVAREEEAIWLSRSIGFAFEAGAGVVSLVPTRSGNGALDALVGQGLFRAPRLVDLERALGAALPESRGRVFADLWDLDRLSDCSECLPARRERLRQMSLRQQARPRVSCGRCEEKAPS